MILLRLFWEFFKTGLFAVGGGMATLPFLYDMAAKTQEIYETLWQYEMSDEEAAAMLAAVPVA